MVVKRVKEWEMEGGGKRKDSKGRKRERIV